MSANKTVVGDHVSMKVWRVSDPEPESPQWTFTDSTYLIGKFGVTSNIHDSLFPGSARISVAFDDFYFVPTDIDNSSEQ